MTKSGDLPIARSTRLEFAINLKIAKALGLTIPETKLANMSTSTKSASAVAAF